MANSLPQQKQKSNNKSLRGEHARKRDQELQIDKSPTTLINLLKEEVCKVGATLSSVVDKWLPQSSSS